MVTTNPTGLLDLPLTDPQRAAAAAVDFHSSHPVDAVIPVDEDTAVVAAVIAKALGLEHNTVGSVLLAKNKLSMRLALKSAGLRVPAFWSYALQEPREKILDEATYPCVIKPLFLSTSRGVMRADDPRSLLAAIERLERILARPEIARKGGALSQEALVEEYIPGDEVAVEGLITNGVPRVLAIFDKPDPLVGPFFEETIYVTPSRHSAAVQRDIEDETAAAIRAIGLTRGPVHAELRVNDQGPWVLEVAARPIGGLCSNALRFDGGISLEELILHHAAGASVDSCQRETAASGVMMIPIPKSGVLREVRGVSHALRIPNVEDVIISAHVSQELIPPPEGAAYLGFIFSRAGDPDRVEASLRDAHRCLEFIID
jgi:biotin carboxylase